MANRDGTGPNGDGPRTGRQDGNCEGARPVARRNGSGQGRGRRRFNSESISDIFK